MHSKVRKDVFVVLALAFVVMLMSSVPAQALPMFARRSDGANCTKCHWQQNALNATGRAYLKHGIRDVGETVDLREAELRLSQYMSLVVAPSLSAVKNDTTAFSGGEVALWTGGPVDSNFSLVSEIAFLVDEDAVEAEEVYAHFVTNAGTGQNGKAATVGGAVADGEEEDEPEDDDEERAPPDAGVPVKHLHLLLGRGRECGLIDPGPQDQDAVEREQGPDEEPDRNVALFGAHASLSLPEDDVQCDADG